MTRLIKQGFTLIEMAITIAVIVIVSVVAYANYNEINDTGEILTVSDKLREQVRLALNFSINGKQIKGKTANGWGVYFNRTTNKYAIYADLNHKQRYDYPTKLLMHCIESFSG